MKLHELDMRDRIVESARLKARREAALALIAETGSASQEQIDARTAGFVPPAGAALEALVAEKLAAAAVYEAREAKVAAESAANAQAKVAKFEALLAGVKADAAEAARQAKLAKTSGGN